MRIIVDIDHASLTIFNEFGTFSNPISNLTITEQTAITTFIGSVESLIPERPLKKVKAITTKIPEGVTNIAFSVTDDTDFNSLIYYENNLQDQSQKDICDNFLAVMPKFVDMQVIANVSPVIIISDGIAKKTFIEYGD